MNNDQTVELQAFKMYDRLYFVGTEEVSVHLIDTEEGLVLIDTGFPNMYDDIINNIKKNGI